MLRCVPARNAHQAISRIAQDLEERRVRQTGELAKPDSYALALKNPDETLHLWNIDSMSPMCILRDTLSCLGSARARLNEAATDIRANPTKVVQGVYGSFRVSDFGLHCNVHLPHSLNLGSHLPLIASRVGFSHALMAAASSHTVSTAIWFIDRVRADSMEAVLSTPELEGPEQAGDPFPLTEGVLVEQWLEDAEMLTAEHVVIGLRSPWMRRVAVPVIKAGDALSDKDTPYKDRPERALEILEQCQDPAFKAACRGYIGHHYNLG